KKIERERPLRTLTENEPDSPDRGTGQFVMQPNDGVATIDSGEYVSGSAGNADTTMPSSATRTLGGASKPSIATRKATRADEKGGKS
ncbi:MAG: hypothetical protein AAF368_01870, partial [Planctomycetota bacterium]